MIHTLRGGAKAVVATVGAVGLTVALAASPAAALTSSGQVTITQSGTNTPLTGPQSSSTPFSATVPPGTKCAKTTPANQWHVFSFLVPAATDPATQNFSSGFPTNGLGYFDSSGSYVGTLSTSSTGLIIGVPSGLNWGAAIDVGNTDEPTLTGGTSQTWDSGLACVDNTGVMQTFYDQQITFTHVATTADSRGFKWTPATTTGALVPESPLTIALPLGGFAVLGVGVYMNRRRTTRRRGVSVA